MNPRKGVRRETTRGRTLERVSGDKDEEIGPNNNILFQPGRCRRLKPKVLELSGYEPCFYAPEARGSLLVGEEHRLLELDQKK